MRPKIRKTSNESGFIDTAIFGEMVDYGRHILRAGMDFTRWATQMLKDLGAEISPYLRRIWQVMNEGLVDGGIIGASNWNSRKGIRAGIDARSLSRPETDKAVDQETKLNKSMAEWKRQGVQASIREEAAASRAGALREKLDHTVPGTALNEALFREIADFGRLVFRQGMDYLDWSMRMVRDLGAKVTAHLPRLWSVTNSTTGNGQPLIIAQATTSTRPNSRASSPQPSIVSGGRSPDLLSGKISIASSNYGPRFRGSPDQSTSNTIKTLYAELQEIRTLLENARKQGRPHHEQENLKKQQRDIHHEILRLEGNPWYSPEQDEILDAPPVRADEVPETFVSLLQAFDNLNIPSVWTSGIDAKIEYAADGNLRFLLPLTAFESTADQQKAGLQPFTDAFAMFGEEITHGAIASHARDKWIASGRIGSFQDYVHKTMAEAFSDLRSTIEAAPASQRKFLMEAIRDSYYIYFDGGKTAEISELNLEKLLSDIETGSDATNFVLEFVRQASQLQRQGHITEAVRQRTVATFLKIADWIRPALERLRRALPRAYRGDFGRKIQEMIKITDSILDGLPLEMQPAQLNDPAISDSNPFPTPDEP